MNKTMSKELVKIDVANLAIMNRTDLLDAEVAKQYPEIPNAFNSLYIQVQAKASEAKAIIDTFESAETDEEKLTLSPLAKKLISEVKAFKGKNGAIEIKASFKDIPMKINRLTDGGFNAVKGLVDETIDPLEVIAKHADVIAYNKAQALDKERTEQITILGGEAFLYKYPAGFGNFTPEQFDDILQDFEGFIKLANFEEAEAKRQAEAEALKAKADSEKQMIRTARAKQLHAVNSFYDGDLAGLTEVEFMQVLEKAQADKVEADKKAEALRLESERKQVEEKAKQDAELLKAVHEAEVLLKEKKAEQAKQAQQEKALQGGDAEKFKVLADKAKELMAFAEKIEGMQSDKGQKALNWYLDRITALSSDSYSLYNKLR